MCKDQNRNDPFKRTAFKSTTSVSPAYMFCLVFKCLPADVGLVAWHVLASDQGAGGPDCGWEEEGEEPQWDEQPSYQREASQSLTESGHDALDDHLVTSLIVPSRNQSHVWSLKVVSMRRSHKCISPEHKEHWRACLDLVSACIDTATNHPRRSKTCRRTPSETTQLLIGSSGVCVKDQTDE